MPTTTTVGDRVDTPSLAYQEMWLDWELIRDLRGGTRTMRAAGDRWLPVEPKEQDRTYRLRLSRAILYGGLNNAIRQIVAKPYAKAVTTKGDDALPEPLQRMLDRPTIDREHDLTAFARSMFVEAVTWGLVHVLVDSPPQGEALSLGEQRQLDIRPHAKMISPIDMIGWRTRRAAAGNEELEQIRYVRWITETVGRFGERRVKHVRVMTAPGEMVVPIDDQGNVAAIEQPGTWEVWRIDPDTDREELIDSGTHTYPGIPLVTFYTARTGLMTARPPMLEVADANLAHWQTTADKRNALRVALYSLIHESGVSAEEKDEQLLIGPVTLVRRQQAGATMRFVNSDGRNIQAGSDEQRALETQMQVLGMMPLFTRSGDQTATGRAIDEGQAISDVQCWIRDQEHALRGVFEAGARWLTQELSDEFAVDVYSDFGIGLRASEEVANLIAMATTGKITNRTLLVEMKRRAILSDDVDVDEEIAALEAESTGLRDMGDTVFTTGPENGREGGHAHTYSEGDSQTSLVNGHSHAVLPDGSIGRAGEPEHTHAPDARASAEVPGANAAA